MITSTRRHIAVMGLYFTFAFFIAVVDRAPIHLEKGYPFLEFTNNFTNYINAVVAGSYPGPYVYRILIPFVVTAVHNILPFVSTVDIDFLLKILILVACQLSFYYFLSNFYSRSVSYLAVFLLNAFLSISLSSIQGPTTIETADLFNVLVFIVALIALLKGSNALLYIILLIGTLNRETTLFLLPIVVLHNVHSKQPILTSILASLAVVVPFTVLRLFIDTPDPSWFTIQGLPRNIPFIDDDYRSEAIVSNIHVFVLLGPLALIALFDLNKHHVFLKQMLYVVPPFLATHYIFGTIIETRLWMPLYVIIIPGALNTISRAFGNPEHAT